MGGDEESLKEALQCRAWQDSGIRTLNTEEVVGGPWAAGECREKSPGKGYREKCQLLCHSDESAGYDTC